MPFLLDPRVVMIDNMAKAQAGAQRDRVLVVDDEQDARELFAVVLTDAGYAVEVAHGGLDAIDKVSRAQPDLVLTDLQMPGMHGLDLIAELKRIDDELPVVLATGVETRDLMTNADLYGAVTCLEKPVDLEELFWTIDLALASRRGPRLAVLGQP